MSIELKDFSEIDLQNHDLKDIAATTSLNSNKSVRQNLGMYKYYYRNSNQCKYRTGRYCGITWLRNKDGGIREENGNKCTLQIKPRFGLNIDNMIHKIAEDDEFFEYLCDDQDEGDRMFTFFFDEEMMEVSDDPLGGHLMVSISFIHLLYQETRRKIIRRIVHKEDNFTGKIKGRILFNKHIQKNLVQGHEERIYCGYVEKSEDIYENRVLKYALMQARDYLMSQMIQNAQIMREIKACELRFSNVTNIDDVDAEEIDSIRLPVMYSNFEKLMKLAYLVVSEINMTSNLKNDANKIVPYAVNMPLLFECYCRTLVKEQIKDDPEIKMLKFVANKSGDYDESEYGIKTIQGKYYISGKLVPDIVLKKNDKNYVFDVKYKNFSWNIKNGKAELKHPHNPDRRDDRLQLLAYNEIFKPEFCGHICPRVKDISVKNTSNAPILRMAKQISANKPKYYMFYLNETIDIKDLIG